VNDPAVLSSIRERGYAQQGALVWEVIEALHLPFESFTDLFVEKSPPYCVRRVTLSDAALGRARRQNRAMLRVIADCIDKNEWPGFDDIENADVAKTEQDRIDQRLERMGV